MTYFKSYRYDCDPGERDHDFWEIFLTFAKSLGPFSDESEKIIMNAFNEYDGVVEYKPPAPAFYLTVIAINFKTEAGYTHFIMRWA